MIGWWKKELWAGEDFKCLRPFWKIGESKKTLDRNSPTRTDGSPSFMAKAISREKLHLGDCSDKSCYKTQQALNFQWLLRPSFTESTQVLTWLFNILLEEIMLQCLKFLSTGSTNLAGYKKNNKLKWTCKLIVFLFGLTTMVTSELPQIGGIEVNRSKNNRTIFSTLQTLHAHTGTERWVNWSVVISILPCHSTLFSCHWSHTQTRGPSELFCGTQWC